MELYFTCGNRDNLFKLEAVEGMELTTSIEMARATIEEVSTIPRDQLIQLTEKEYEAMRHIKEQKSGNPSEAVVFVSGEEKSSPLKPSKITNLDDYKTSAQKKFVIENQMIMHSNSPDEGSLKFNVDMTASSDQILRPILTLMRQLIDNCGVDENGVIQLVVNAKYKKPNK